VGFIESNLPSTSENNGHRAAYQRKHYVGNAGTLIPSWFSRFSDALWVNCRSFCDGVIIFRYLYLYGLPLILQFLFQFVVVRLI
jgi:hypothetical protein